MLTAAPPTAAGRHQGDERAGELGEDGQPEAELLGHEPGQRQRRARVGQRRQAQRGDAPSPVGRPEHGREAVPGQLAREQVGGHHAGDQRHQGAQPDPLELHRRDLAAGDVGQQPLAQRGQHAPAAAQLVPGGAGERDRLQQRHGGDDLVGRDLRHRQVGRSVRADEQGQLGHQLRPVEPDLQVGRGHVAGRGGEQQDAAVVGQQHVVGGERPVGHPVRVQSEHVVPDPAELGVGRLGGVVGQRRPVVVLVGEHGRFLPGLDQRPQPRHGNVGVPGRVREQRQPLHRAVL